MLFMPDKEYIKNLEVGDLTLDPFGNMSEVVEITAKKQNIDGNWFVCYYVKFGDNGATISYGLTENELSKTVGLGSKYTGKQMDKIEVKMLKERNLPIPRRLEWCQ